ncbi:MAG TPA: hypothetical protein VFS43_40530 [Polyangiaceae bacterium]|nr:hypothetical protein [Polyangiaceae bacterium]
MQSRLAPAGHPPAARPAGGPRPRPPVWALAALAALCLTLGCATTSRRTHVERGERYRSGSARFDAYFADVHASRRDLDAAAERRRRARARLARSLGLDPDAGEGSIARSMRERSERLAHKGIHLHVGRNGASSQGGAEGASPLVQNLSSCVRTEADTVEWSGRARHRADDLRRRGRGLEPHVDELPRTRRSETRHELRAADHDLYRQSERARSMGTDSEHFIESLRQAAEDPKRTHKTRTKAPPKGRKHRPPSQSPDEADPPETPAAEPDDFNP